MDGSQQLVGRLGGRQIERGRLPDRPSVAPATPGLLDVAGDPNHLPVPARELQLRLWHSPLPPVGQIRLRERLVGHHDRRPILRVSILQAAALKDGNAQGLKEVRSDVDDVRDPVLVGGISTPTILKGMLRGRSYGNVRATAAAFTPGWLRMAARLWSNRRFTLAALA